MEKLLVWGTGSYYEKKKDSIHGEIIAFVDNYREGKFETKNIIKPNKIKEYEFDAIYIMSSQFVMLGYCLLELGIEKEKIRFGVNEQPYNAIETVFIDDKKRIMINEDNMICYKTQNEEIAVTTYDELVNIREIYGDYSYSFYNGTNEAVAMDIGANIGGASVWLSNIDNISKVYSYEPFSNTCDICNYNINKNVNAKRKVQIVQAGIGIKEEVKKINYNPKMSCGLSVIDEVNKKKFKIYDEWGLINQEETRLEKIKILDISDELNKILKENPNKEIVLKMDCEGSEYELFEKLDKDNLFKKINIIMLEWHYKGPDDLEKILKKNDFSYFSLRKDETHGSIYAVNK